ncbi:MBL fold metallo-hydrolase [Nocardia rhamnosiphila]|uniref:MBL fold metallo-hydrolase n=1 Tax=Nocardia rhamnosiphila TaxID=426716 RepID=UPI00068CC616|nr:MBL fold metallo-hydrolase [Nocardia rhamnosiphila]
MKVEPVEVADDVFFVGTRLVNWVLLVDGKSVTLVDTGYPGQFDDVLSSIRSIGRDPREVEAILITHAHIDHLGGALSFTKQYNTPVYLHRDELEHARREAHYGLSPIGVIKNLWRPGVLPWIVSALPVGVAVRAGLADPLELPGDRALDLPGGPVPVPTAGHTPGHTMYLLPRAKVLISGDGLVTGHPTSRLDGPQLVPAMFDDDREGAARMLGSLVDLDAEVILPGHGAVHRGPVGAAATMAQNRSGVAGTPAHPGPANGSTPPGNIV